MKNDCSQTTLGSRNYVVVAVVDRFTLFWVNNASILVNLHHLLKVRLVPKNLLFRFGSEMLGDFKCEATI